MHRDKDITRYVQTALAAFAFGMLVALCSGIGAVRAACCTGAPVAVERINPNRATAPSLMRLPGIGRMRAMDILAGRDERPFDTPADLERIRGIGPKTVEKIKPYLIFEEQNTIKQIE